MSTYQDERFPLPTPRRLIRELQLERPPIWLVVILAGIFVIGWLPLGWAAKRRSTTSTKPRIHLVQDMDVQPRFGPQSANPMFADGRSMRPPVEGTVARGHLDEDEHLALGYHSLAEDGGSSAVEFFADLPPSLGDPASLVPRGKVVFDIYCAVCHGAAGDGNGLVHQRAVQRGDPQWVAPADLRKEEIRARAAGHLYQTIREGIRSMPGYGSQIDVEDRWAVVAYLLRDLEATGERP